MVRIVLVPALVIVVAGLVTSLVTWTGRKVVEPLAGPRTISFETGTGPLIHVEIDQGLGCLGSGVVFPADSGITDRMPPGTGPTVDGATWDVAPGAFGAVPAQAADLLITLTGPADHAVVLTGMTIHVVEKRPPLAGTYLQHADGCGAGGTFRYGEVRLDSEPPYWVDGPLPEWVTSERLAFPYTVGAEDPELLLVHVTGPTCWCSWTATLTWVDGAISGESVLDDDGRPFELTGSGGLPLVSWTARDADSYERTVLTPEALP